MFVEKYISIGLSLFSPYYRIITVPATIWIWKLFCDQIHRKIQFPDRQTSFAQHSAKTMNISLIKWTELFKSKHFGIGSMRLCVSFFLFGLNTKLNCIALLSITHIQTHVKLITRLNYLLNTYICAHMDWNYHIKTEMISQFIKKLQRNKKYMQTLIATACNTKQGSSNQLTNVLLSLYYFID